MKRCTRGSVLLLTLLVASAWASEPLPDPLTLDDAIALADDSLPAVELARAQRDADAATLAEVESLNGVRLSAIGRLRAVRPSYLSPNRDNNDSSAQLLLRKRLYDFGYSDAREKAARLAGEGGEWRYLGARQQTRLDIMQRFFDVILADLQYAHDNEAMALAFIDADRARDRHELKRLSDVDLLAIEATYQESLRARMQSQAAQRATRSHLAIAMGRPGDLAPNVVRPSAPDTEVALPEYEALVEEIIAGNPELKALRAEVEASRSALEAARNGHGPVLSAEMEASVYNRMTNSTHPLGAGLVLEVPLLTGGAKDAAIAAAGATMRQRSAQLAAAEHAMRQRVLELRLRLDDIKLFLAGLQVRSDYRELYLDRSRALYELEVKTDLGDAMTEITAVMLDTARAEFDWIMTKAELDALAGRLMPEEQTQ